MQNTEKPASNGTGELPAMELLGPNKIAQAMEDYGIMANELQRTKAELLEQITLGRRLLAENEAVRNQMQAQTDFLTRQVDAANTRAHILGATLTTLRANYATIREIFTRCETEALAAGVEAAEVVPEQPIKWPEAEEPQPPPRNEASEEQRQALQELELYAPKRSPAPYQT